jgi:GxxExxY protein
MSLISEISVDVGTRHESVILHSPITGDILSAAFEVHRELGPGLLESAYQACLCHELSCRGLSFRTEVPLPVRYKDVRLECGYRIDLVVEDKIAVELKSVDKILPIHQAQLLTYLRLSGLRVGLLMNFNVRMLKDGILRRVL